MLPAQKLGILLSSIPSLILIYFINRFRERIFEPFFMSFIILMVLFMAGGMYLLMKDDREKRGVFFIILLMAAILLALPFFIS